MHILVINGNSSTWASDSIESAARLALWPGVTLSMLTPPTAPPTIEGYLDAELSALAVCEQIALHRKEADAFVIACFSDPGLAAARTIVSQPVVGIAEASLVTAVQIGLRFGLLTPLRHMRPILAGLVRSYGFESRLAGIQNVDLNVAQSGQPGPARMNAFGEAGRRAIAEDGAEVLILAGAVMAGMEVELSSQLGLPVLDPVKCAVAQAQALMQLGLSTSRAGGYPALLARDCRDCPPGIADVFRHSKRPEQAD